MIGRIDEAMRVDVSPIFYTFYGPDGAATRVVTDRPWPQELLIHQDVIAQPNQPIWQVLDAEHVRFELANGWANYHLIEADKARSISLWGLDESRYDAVERG